MRNYKKYRKISNNVENLLYDAHSEASKILRESIINRIKKTICEAKSMSFFKGNLNSGHEKFLNLVLKSDFEKISTFRELKLDHNGTIYSIWNEGDGLLGDQLFYVNFMIYFLRESLSRNKIAECISGREYGGYVFYNCECVWNSLIEEHDNETRLL